MSDQLAAQIRCHDHIPVSHRCGGLVGTQDICLAVGRTEGADYSRWGSQPSSSDHPGHGTRPPRAAHFTRQSYLPTHRSHMAAPNHSGPTGGAGGGSLAVRTSINGTFIQSSTSFLLLPSIWCETQTPAMPCQLCSGKTSPAENRWEIMMRIILTTAMQCGNEENQL